MHELSWSTRNQTKHIFRIQKITKPVIKKNNLILITLNMSDKIITILSKYPTDFYLIIKKKKTKWLATHSSVSYIYMIYKTKHMHLSFLKKFFSVYEKKC